MRNVANREQLTFTCEQIVSEGTVLEGRVSDGFSSLRIIGLPISPIWLSPLGLPEKEIVQPNNMLAGIFMSGFVNPFIATAKSDKKFTIDHIDVDHKTLAFAKPIVGNISLDNGIYICKSEELDIISASPDVNDCTNDFKEEVLFIYNEYGKEDDSKLTEGAKELKRKILEYVGN